MSERSIGIENPRSLKKFFFRWEWLLVLVFVAVNVVNGILSPYYLDFGSLIGATNSFLDMAFLVLPMTFVIIMGNIDISVASTVALSAVVMATSFNAGLPMPLAMALCLVVATACGLVNGLIMVKFKELPAMIVTLATMTIYRGIAYVVLEDQAAGGFPEWYSYLGWGTIGPVPFVLPTFAACAIFFSLLLHKTSFGRKVFAVGNNVVAARYSGIRTDSVVVIVSALTGLMAGFTALFLTSRMGSTRPNVASGYELAVIAMVVLGGVSTSGGSGGMVGPILSIFIIGFLTYGLGLVNVKANVLLIVIGSLLILSVLVLNIRFGKGNKRRLSPASKMVETVKRPDSLK
jgi:rhamnose transport system permease protein